MLISTHLPQTDIDNTGKPTPFIELAGHALKFHAPGLSCLLLLLN